MASFVLLHGGMHGGWCWRRVRRLLAAQGHEVFTPTLTGLGDRAHLGGPEVDLSLHIEDVRQFILCEELEDAVLVGHSYGGMVITGVADRIGERIARLIYLDALVPADGQSAANLIPGSRDYDQLAGQMLQPFPGYDFGVTEPEDIAWVRRRVTPQSARTLVEPVRLRHPSSRLRRAFIECSAGRQGHPLMQQIAAGAARIAADPDWAHYVMDAPHDCMITHPHETASLLASIAASP